MSFASITLATVLVTLPALPLQFGPPLRTPLRNAFITATESVLDQEASLDLNANPTAFDAGLTTLNIAEQNLAVLAGEDRETDIVSAVKNMHFTLASCRIQAVDGADISKCLLRLSDHRSAIMQMIHKHKVNGSWTDGDAHP